MPETKRLILRNWKKDDLKSYFELNSDPHTMRFFPSIYDREKSDKQALEFKNFIDKNGWGAWAVELKSTGEFIGFTGFFDQDEKCGLPFAPLLEIGWRLKKDHWGKGYAPEAAKEALKYAFHNLKADKVYAFTSILNEPSMRVMEKIGMENIDNNFNHPQIPAGSILERHCIYRIMKEDFQS